MTCSERIFRLFSLVLVGMTVVAAGLGADADRETEVVALEDLIQDMQAVQDIAKINRGEMDSGQIGKVGSSSATESPDEESTK